MLISGTKTNRNTMVLITTKIVIARKNSVTGRGNIFSDNSARVTTVRRSGYREDNVDGFVFP